MREQLYPPGVGQGKGTNKFKGLHIIQDTNGKLYTSMSVVSHTF